MWSPQIDIEAAALELGDSIIPAAAPPALATTSSLTMFCFGMDKLCCCLEGGGDLVEPTGTVSDPTAVTSVTNTK